MSVYVRYEYDQKFESTKKKYDHWTMTWLVRDRNLRSITENGY